MKLMSGLDLVVSRPPVIKRILKPHQSRIVRWLRDRVFRYLGREASVAIASRAGSSADHVGGTDCGHSRPLSERLPAAMKGPDHAPPKMNRARKANGEKPVPRKRGIGARAFDKGWLSPTQWEHLMARRGFRVTKGERRLTEVPRR